MEVFIHISGWIGTVLIVWAYYLVSNQKLDPSGRKYQVMNLIGSIAVGINVFYLKVWAAVALEIVWSVIAIATLVKMRPRS